MSLAEYYLIVAAPAVVAAFAAVHVLRPGRSLLQKTNLAFGWSLIVTIVGTLGTYRLCWSVLHIAATFEINNDQFSRWMRDSFVPMPVAIGSAAALFVLANVIRRRDQRSQAGGLPSAEAPRATSSARESS